MPIGNISIPYSVASMHSKIDAIKLRALAKIIDEASDREGLGSIEKTALRHLILVPTAKRMIGKGISGAIRDTFFSRFTKGRIVLSHTVTRDLSDASTARRAKKARRRRTGLGGPADERYNRAIG